MAHKITVFSRPHQNKNGSISETKKDWFFRDRHRSGRTERGPFTSETKALLAVEEYRAECARAHAERHPNDLISKRKEK